MIHCSNKPNSEMKLVDTAVGSTGSDIMMEAIVRLSKTYRATTSQEDAFRQLCNSVDIANATGEPAGLVLAGESGTGKTSTLKRWREWARATLPERPVYVVETLGESTPKSIAASILVAAGDPFAWKGTGPATLERVNALVEEQKPLAIALDEFQHLFESNTRAQVATASKLVKNLFNKLPVPVVLVGLPDVIGFVRGSSELDRRFSKVVLLRPCDFSLAEDLSDFREVLRSIESILPLEPGLSLAAKSMATRFMLSTNGAVGTVVDLAREACVAARDRGASALGLHHFSYALQRLSVGKVNVQDAFSLPDDDVHAVVNQKLVAASKARRRAKE